MAARVVIKNWNADRLLRRVPQRILEDYGPRIAFQTQQEIATKQFDWPTPTVRKNGQVIPVGLRDIVDTGELLESQTDPEISAQSGRISLRITWTAPYSGDVLRGGYLIGTVRNNYIAPSRDWITPALQAQPLKPFFVARWRQIANQR